MEHYNPEDAGFASSNAFSKLKLLPPAAREEFIGLSEIQTFKKKERVLEAYDFSENVYFIYDGMLLSYVQREDENIVKWVRGAGDFAFAQKTENTTVCLQKQLTGQIIVALEETNVIRISFENLERLREKYPQMDHVVTYHIHMYSTMDQWLQASRYFPPKRKYEFVQGQVGFKLSKVPDVYLASWLGITLAELKDVRNSIQ